MKKILVRAYFEKNFGDDLLVYTLVNRYPNCKFIICTPIKYDKNIFNNKNVKFINRYIVKVMNKISYILKKSEYTCNNLILKKCDALVLIGGSIFIQNNDINTENKRLEEILKYTCKDKYIIGSNFGPYKDSEYYQISKKYFNGIKDICLRDEKSYNMFKSLKNVRLGADVVFSMNTNNIFNNPKKNIVISVVELSYRIGISKYKKEYENKIKELSEYFINRGYTVTLMSFCKFEGDEEAIKRIFDIIENKYKKDVSIYFYSGKILEALNIIGKSQIVIASRFHSMIIGLLLGKTVIPIIYSDKTLNTINDIRFNGKYVDIIDISNFDINSITEDDLSYKLDISQVKINSNKQFEKLDEYLKGE